MNRSFVLFLGLLLVASAMVSADINNWQIKIGVDDNTYPYGNDVSTRLGVDPAGTWDYDARDAVHPPIGDPENDLGFIYDKLYYKVYQDKGYGWPPAWKPQIPAGKFPTYPSPGLLKDTREPILTDGRPEFWRVIVQAPRAGETISFKWAVNTEAGFEVPNNLYLKVLGNPELAAAGVVGDLDLLAQGAGQHSVTGITQWGFDTDQGIPIKKLWVIEAGITPIPEPGTIVLMTGGLVGMAGLIRRRK